MAMFFEKQNKNSKKIIVRGVFMKTYNCIFSLLFCSMLSTNCFGSSHEVQSKPKTLKRWNQKEKFQIKNKGYVRLKKKILDEYESGDRRKNEETKQLINNYLFAIFISHPTLFKDCMRVFNMCGSKKRNSFYKKKNISENFYIFKHFCLFHAVDTKKINDYNQDYKNFCFRANEYIKKELSKS
jgi:hypothetical protein